MWHWLLTSTTYGTWLPGDARGSVASVRDHRLGDARTGVRIEHDQVGEAWEPPLPALSESSRGLMKGEPVWLTRHHAQALLSQFRESATHRGWSLLAASIMSNHFHLLVRTAVDTKPEKLLQTFKSYGSRALSNQFGKPASGTWWTKSGSKRKLPNEGAVLAAINYVVNRQHRPLMTWSESSEARTSEPTTENGEPTT